MPSADQQVRDEHHDCRQMALALEGLAGSLHAGLPVAASDLAMAASAASLVWEAGPVADLPRATDFEEALNDFVHAFPGCARGVAHDVAVVETAAQRMALQLRWTSQDIAGPPPRHGLEPYAGRASSRKTPSASSPGCASDSGRTASWPASRSRRPAATWSPGTPSSRSFLDRWRRWTGCIDPPARRGAARQRWRLVTMGPRGARAFWT